MNDKCKNYGIKSPWDNKVVCDEDYTGEYKVAIHNDSQFTAFVNHEERIAQLVFIPYISADFVVVDNLDESERGANGFGSTGSK